MAKVRQHFQWPDGRIVNIETSPAAYVVLACPDGRWRFESLAAGRGEALWAVRLNEQAGIRSRNVPVHDGWAHGPNTITFDELVTATELDQP